MCLQSCLMTSLTSKLFYDIKDLMTQAQLTGFNGAVAGVQYSASRGAGSVPACLASASPLSALPALPAPPRPPHHPSTLLILHLMPPAPGMPSPPLCRSPKAARAGTASTPPACPPASAPLTAWPAPTMCRPARAPHGTPAPPPFATFGTPTAQSMTGCATKTAGACAVTACCGSLNGRRGGARGPWPVCSASGSG